MDQLTALLGERPCDAEELGGGITDWNYRMRMGGVDYAVRVTSPESSLLGIDRRSEHVAALAAAVLGVAPPVAGFLEDAGCLITEFLPGRPLPPPADATPGTETEVDIFGDWVGAKVVRGPLWDSNGERPRA